MSEVVKAADFVHALPVIFVALWACVVLLATSFGDYKSSRLGPISVFGMVGALGICIWSWSTHSYGVSIFGGMMVVDRFSLFIDVIVILATILTILLSGAYLEEHDFARAEYYPLMLISVTGMMLMVHSNDFISILIGLETMSLGVYSMVASWTKKRKSAEGGIKYFVMGGVASAFLLYGIALIYGLTGATNLAEIARKSSTLAGNPLFILAMFMVIGAMAFKVALVPFHMWTPDAYEGAPTPVTGFMAAAVKAAGFALLLRVLHRAFGADFFVYGSTGWANIFYTLSIITMTVGNIAALRQNNIKRMLAYSSISHAGFILMGVLAASIVPGGDQGPVLFYLLVYGLTTVGAFGVVGFVGNWDVERLTIDEWAGLAYRRPGAALAMTIFLLSLAGLPPMAGFFSKFYILKSALGHSDLLSLVIIAVINSMIAIYYYLRPIIAMYFQEGTDAGDVPLRSGALTFAIIASVVLVLLLGLMPEPTLTWAGQAIIALVG